MITTTELRPHDATGAVTRLFQAIARRWSASAEYLRATADNPDADPTAAEEAFEEVRDALDAFSHIDSDATARILAIMEEHNPRALPKLAQALGQLAQEMRREALSAGIDG